MHSAQLLLLMSQTKYKMIINITRSRYSVIKVAMIDITVFRYRYHMQIIRVYLPWNLYLWQWMMKCISKWIEFKPFLTPVPVSRIFHLKKNTCHSTKKSLILNCCIAFIVFSNDYILWILQPFYDHCHHDRAER